MVQHERGHEQRPIQHLRCVSGGLGGGLDTLKLVVNRGKVGAMGADVGELVGAHAAGFDQQVAAHGQVAVEALARFHLGVIGRDHGCEPPDGHAAPAVGRRKEVPVTHHLASYRIGDVVGGEGKLVDAQQHLAGGQLVGSRDGRLLPAGVLEIVPINQQLKTVHPSSPNSGFKKF